MHIIKGIHEQYQDLSDAHARFKDQSESVDRILVDCMEYINRCRPIMRSIVDNGAFDRGEISRELEMMDEFEGLFFKDEYSRIVKTYKIKSPEHFQQWRTNIIKEEPLKIY